MVPFTVDHVGSGFGAAVTLTANPTIAAQRANIRTRRMWLDSCIGRGSEAGRSGVPGRAGIVRVTIGVGNVPEGILKTARMSASWRPWDRLAVLRSTQPECQKPIEDLSVLRMPPGTDTH